MTMVQTSPAYSLLDNDKLKAIKPKKIAFLAGVFTCLLMIAITNQMSSLLGESSGIYGHLRNSSRIDGVETDDDMNQNKTIEFTGIENAEWCLDPAYPPLPYEDCKFKDFLFRFSVTGGLTNALHFVLKGAMWAYEENVCYFVDERGPNPAQMAMRDEPMGMLDPFLDRYFEPLSLSRDHPKVKWAMRWHKFVEPDYYQIQNHEYGMKGGLRPLHDSSRHRKRDLQSLFAYEKDNIWLKKWMVRRLFRIKNPLRQTACIKLNMMGLNEEYMALSVRRGDKHLEHEIESSLQPYIDRAERAIDKHFGGNVPTIFVASDDCSVMSEIRQLRPTWKFVGACDDASEENGFILTDAKQWTEEQTDKHYTKFVTEMIAMASAKHFIGVSTTNVSFWIYFMRHMNAQDDTWEFVDSDLYPL